MKFTFTSEDDDNGSIVYHNFEALRWDQALDQFVKFLRGSGYFLSDDSVGINVDRHAFAGDDWSLCNITDFSKESI